MRRKLRYRLSKPQATIRRHKARHKVVVAGRRFGKSFLAGVLCLEAALEAPLQNVLWVFPTLKQAKRIAWVFLKTLTRPWWLVRPNESELRIFLVTGSTITLGGADNYDSLRGDGYDFVVLDEYADMNPLAWSEVIRPAMADREGRAFFIGTPKGWNHFKELYDRALSLMQSGSDQWAAFLYRTIDGGRVTEREIEEARREMDEKTFRQEFLASFETLAGRVYYNFSREESVNADLIDTGAELLVGMDFNVNPMAAIVGVRAADQFHVLDNIVIPHSNTEEMACEIERRYGAERGRIVAADAPGAQVVPFIERVARPITVYPDPSGKARKTSAKAGETDFSILRSHGFQVKAPSKAPLVVDRINNVNALLKSAAGDRKLLIHPRAEELIKALDGLTRKEGTNDIDKSLGLDHITDALGYPVSYEFPLVQRTLRRKRMRL